jgi:hypothetical protein
MQACRFWKEYQAVYAPRCNGGQGCEACRAKWMAKQRAAARKRQRMLDAK